LKEPRWSVRARGRGGARIHIDVLVLDAHYRQSLAALQSLARSGLDVGIVACRSEASWAPALRSRFPQFTAVVPDFADDPNGYVEAVLGLLDEYPAQMVLPHHDGSIQALRARRGEVERRTFLPLASEAALDIAASKERTLALARELGIAVPRTVPVDNEGDIRAALDEVGCPAVVKPVRSWGCGTRIGADSVRDFDEAIRELQKIQDAGLSAMIQQWLPGRRDAVSVFSTAGTVWAQFAQTSYREFPPLGGAAVLCESIPPLADIVEPASALVRAADLDGCSMVEFRRDRSGRPVLMEINARMAGSLALAISAGVDFPKMLYSWAVGKPLERITEYRVGRRLRWLSGDVWYLKCVAEGPGRADTPSLSRAVMTCLYDFVRRPSALDGFHLGDLAPALIELRHGFLEPVLGRARKSAFPRPSDRVAEKER
jgi:predicted ATP-grasp superfamily ATP-dependent carboligase